MSPTSIADDSFLCSTLIGVVVSRRRDLSDYGGRKHLGCKLRHQPEKGGPTENGGGGPQEQQIFEVISLDT